MGLTLMRHLFAVLAAWLVAWAAGKGVTLSPEELTGVMMGIYVLTEKLLKPVTVNAGEIQPGAVAARTTEIEKAKVEIAKEAR